MEFSDDVFEDFETVRASGACNMMDRMCVARAANMLLDPDCDLIEVCHDKRRYPKLLLAFSVWKQARDA